MRETKTLIQNFCGEASWKTEKRWENNIKMCLRKVVSLGVNSMEHLTGGDLVAQGDVH
jgi:hypothetical protein